MAPITGGRALVHYGLKKIRLDTYQRAITDAVIELRRHPDAIDATGDDPAELSGVRVADPVGKSGVGLPRPGNDSGVANDLTPAVRAGSASDPGKFSASDPAKFNRQKPYIEEPTPAGLQACTVFSERHLERWRALALDLTDSDVEAILTDELEVAWPLCDGDSTLLQSAALAALPEAERAEPRNLQGFVRCVLRSQIAKLKTGSQHARATAITPEKRRKRSRWGA
jgi:hypothetical protein